MSEGSEAGLDLSEIVGMYKEDARRMIQDMRQAADRWQEVREGGPARQILRRLSHQLRGSGQTYGFRRATLVSKALEQIIQKLENGKLSADERVQRSVATKIDLLNSVFES